MNFPAFQRWTNPDGTLTLDATSWLGGVARVVDVAAEADIPVPPVRNVFYVERDEDGSVVNLWFGDALIFPQP